MVAAKQRKFDAVLVWRFDRFARSTRHLLNALEEFKALGIEFISLSEGIDTSTPAGKVLFTMVGAFAEFERSIIVERIKAGMRNARSKGHISGKKRQQLNLPSIRTRISQGESLRTVAKTLSISPSLLSRRLKESPAQSA
jgi:DNA invertase Pin-like site-specific DNA recombinase